MSVAPLEGAYEKYAGARSALVFLMQQAAEEGILDPDSGPRSAAEIAVRKGSDPGRIAVLCDTLAGYGILQRVGQKFTVSDRFREYVPSEATSSLKQVLSSEGERLAHQAPSHTSPTHIAQTELEMLMNEFRTIAREADVDEWMNGSDVSNSEWMSLESLFTQDSVGGLTGSEPAAPVPVKVFNQQPILVSSTPEAVRHELSPKGVETKPKGVRTKPMAPKPALVALQNETAVRTVNTAALASAFVRTWPLGPYGIGSLSLERGFRFVQASGGSAPGKTRYRLGTLLWVIAAFCLFWAGWDLWGTGLGQARAQKELKAEFARSLAAPGSEAEANVPSGVPGDAPAPVAFNSPPPKVVAGTSVALLKIPSIGVEEVILEGTSVKDLRRGPGHYVGTAFPGQPGNAAIAGHRTTYGAPFYKLGKLGLGDKIEVITRNGTFVYLVQRVYRVAPDDSSPLNPSEENLLTLTTCDPPFSAARRLIVVAKLQGEPDRLPPSTVTPQLIPVATPVPVEQVPQSVAPGLNLQAIKQPVPAPPVVASPSPAGTSTQPPAPAGAPAAQDPVTTTTQPPATTQPPTQPPVNNFVVPQTQPPPPQPAPAPETQPVPQTQPVPVTKPPPRSRVGECSDGIDNDGDGRIDLDDKASCQGDPLGDE